ncbi:YqzL family protein [Virgibacillus siamensis]|uniref:YqzL family protein n=1 Tax=Virgibacillus siamensis TaxID=480071 RepID=UPI000986ADA8|nr:YqzL family protein [Virgibacillus siamensis]
MIDFTWRLFSQTGNIETYLLLKELEEPEQNANTSVKRQDNEQVSSFDTNM